ncbi:hypothetical protein Q0F99_11445 [Rathayibacter oskolensis]|uniref:hypothetical protein n=1 Tax=Rathayibacter oskolensis TaxID=1891671 RepID=UPI0026603814|nr:hypothetical protein [Rathayibacter oskolensis]WKK70479.1 hypothetical protein Q0F99_11445 [Rathayibacter oskolensis]
MLLLLGAAALLYVVYLVGGLFGSAGALKELGGEVSLPAGSPSWRLQIARGTRLSRLERKLSAALAQLDPEKRPRLIPNNLRELGIVTASPIASEQPRAELFAEFHSWSGTGPDLNRYVASALEHASDVPEKLLHHSPDGRKHTFIWVGILSLYPGWSSMRDSAGALPLDEPVCRTV